MEKRSVMCQEDKGNWSPLLDQAVECWSDVVWPGQYQSSRYAVVCSPEKRADVSKDIVNGLQTVRSLLIIFESHCHSPQRCMTRWHVGKASFMLKSNGHAGV